MNGPGLYPVSIVSNPPTGPEPTYPSVTTDVAVQPVFTGLNSTYFSPATSTTSADANPESTTIPIPAFGGVSNVAPSAMAINSTKGYAVIAEQGANAVQIVNLVPNPGASGRLMPQMGVQVAVGNRADGRGD